MTENHDRPTAAIPRDQLLGLVKQTSSLPAPHVIARGSRPSIEQQVEDEGVSPLAVLAVIGVFVALFIAVVQLN